MDDGRPRRGAATFANREADVTDRKREQAMERARSKRRRKKPQEAAEPQGVVGQVTKAVGEAVKSAADAITGK